MIILLVCSSQHPPCLQKPRKIAQPFSQVASPSHSVFFTWKQTQVLMWCLPEAKVIIGFCIFCSVFMHLRGGSNPISEPNWPLAIAFGFPRGRTCCPAKGFYSWNFKITIDICSSGKKLAKANLTAVSLLLKLYCLEHTVLVILGKSAEFFSSCKLFGFQLY